MSTISTGLDLEALLDDLGLIAYRLDARGRIAWVSEVVERMFGYLPDELVGQDALVLVAPEDREIVRIQITRKLKGETDLTTYEANGITKNGARIVVRMISCAVRENGRVTGVKGLACPRPRHQGPPAYLHLTPRQQQTLEMLGAGLTTSEVAVGLGVSHETARNHIRGVLQALGAHSRLEAVTNARQLGLI
jgi:PAS domain S-box-containing protein